MPIAIFVEFENYAGPKFFDPSSPKSNWIPINPLSIYSKNIGTRTQYPLRLAYAFTIHKSQGQTLDKVVIDLGKKEISLGLTFVALSRVRNYKDFVIKPLTLERLKKIKLSSSLAPRLAEECRIQKITENTFESYSYLIIS